MSGIAALLRFLLVLADTAVTLLPGDTDPEPGSLGVGSWFTILREWLLLGLRSLGLLNVANLLLSLPLFAALSAADRGRMGRRWAGLALLA